MKTSIENVRFKLKMRTADGWVALPAIRREENYDGEGSLQLLFSQVYGLGIEEFRLNVVANGGPHVGTSLEFPDVGFHEDYDDEECSEYRDVTLTAAQLQQLLADLDAKTEIKFNWSEIRVEYRPLNDGANVRHCVTVQYHHAADEYLEDFGVTRQFRCFDGVIDDEYTCAGIVTIKGRFASQEKAENFINRMAIANNDIQNAIDREEAESGEAEPEPVDAEPATV